MNSDAKKLELYLLLCQSSTALLVSLINATRNSSPEIQMVIKRRLLQLVKTLWEYLRDSAEELEDHEANDGSIPLERSRSVADLSSAFRSSLAQKKSMPREFPVPPRLPHHSTMIDQHQRAHATRFPMIQRLLTVLAQSPNEEIFVQAAQPFSGDPMFRQRLQHEMNRLRGMLGEDDPSLHFGEQTLLERLDRMELSIEQIMRQLNALTGYSHDHEEE